MIHVVRVLFLLLVSIVGAIFIWSTLVPVTATSTSASKAAELPFDPTPYLIFSGVLVAAFAVITIDLLYQRKNLSALSGMLFGVLVGVLISVCLGYLIDEAATILLYRPISGQGAERLAAEAANANMHNMLQGIKVLLGLMVTYLSVSFILQTKDDFRFIIPYVEFQRATRGPRPLILDTSVIIDGRVADLAVTGMFEATILVPRFVLNELQTIADSADRLKRSRGRRGLDVLEKLKALPRVELRFWDGTLANAPAEEGVDQKLVALAQQEHGKIVTNDFNLNKVAALRGVSVININSIAEAVKPVVLPGEAMKVRIVKPGENAGQGVGYLEDGTMVVVEGARDRVGTEIEIIVTNMIQNAAGKMIFGRTDGHAVAAPAAGAARPHRGKPAESAAPPAAPDE